MKNLPLIAAGALLAGFLWLTLAQPRPPAPAPPPATPPVAPAKPKPDCPDGRCPRRPRCPCAITGPTLLGASVAGPKHPDGTEIDCDLPGQFHQKNTGGSDGAGLCVYASARHSGLFADEPVFASLFQWMLARPGGSYPEKFDKTVAQFCQEKGVAVPKYIQVQSADLGILERACAAGLMPGVTYWKSPTGRYGGQQISHMVSLVAAQGDHWAVLDNNYPGEQNYEWMSRSEFSAAYMGSQGKGWAVIPLKPGPPPIPHS